MLPDVDWAVCQQFGQSYLILHHIRAVILYVVIFAVARRLGPNDQTKACGQNHHQHEYLFREYTKCSL